MSIKRLAAIGVVFFGSSVAWMILGVVNAERTEKRSTSLSKRVQNAYGGPLAISPPRIFYEVPEVKRVEVNGVETVSSSVRREFLDPSRSDVRIDLKLKRRKVGNLWFPVFSAEFRGDYEFSVDSVPEGFRRRPLFLLPNLSSSESLYRGIEMRIGDAAVEPLGRLVASTPIELEPADAPRGKVEVSFRYETTGTGRVRYALGGSETDPGPRLARLDGFNLKLTADFAKYDFPERTIPPTGRGKAGGSNEFIWALDRTVTAKDIGLVVPEEKNPGEIAARISFFAPVSLLFFVVVLTISGVLAGRGLHPMHYFLLAATFFSFHLLFSYSADLVPMHAAFGAAAAVSCGLTYTYLARVNGPAFAAFATGLQLIYLVAFSWSFFFETPSGLGITGLLVTTVSVITLFALMQATCRVEWERVIGA